MFEPGYYASVAPVVYVQTSDFWSNFLIGALGATVGSTATGFISWLLLILSNRTAVKNEEKRNRITNSERELTRIKKIQTIIQYCMSSMRMLNRNIHDCLTEEINKFQGEVNYSRAIKPLVGHIRVADLPESDDLLVLHSMNQSEMIGDICALIINYNIIIDCIEKYNKMHEELQRSVMLNSERDMTGTPHVSLKGKGGIEIELRIQSLNRLMNSIVFDIQEDLVRSSKFIIKFNTFSNIHFKQKLKTYVNSQIELYTDNIEYIKKHGVTLYS